MIEQYKLGCLRDPYDKRDYKFTAYPTQVAVTPLSVDLRFPGTVIRNQGSLGSCVAFAGCALFELRQRQLYNVYNDYSELFLYKEARDLGNLQGDVGAYPRDGMRAMNLEGLPGESYWPYIVSKVNEEAPQSVHDVADKMKALDYYSVAGTGTTLLNNLKATLGVVRVPVLIGVQVYNQIFNVGPDGIIAPPGGSSPGRHAMAIVGYSDAKQALLVQNSWGPGWGMNGYGWLPYAYILQGDVDLWFIVKETELNKGVTMLCEFGTGDVTCFIDTSLKKLRETYKMSGGHWVSPDLEPWKDISDKLHKYGMKSRYNVEMAIWAGKFDVNYDITPFRPNLKAIKASGWNGTICEGISAKQVAVLMEDNEYYNEGGEAGENVYATNSKYYRPLSMATGNWLECYHKPSSMYDGAITSANQSTPDDMGLVLMLYTTGELYFPDPAPLITYIKQKMAQGVKIKRIIFWVGKEHNALTKLDNEFNYLWKALDNEFHFTTEDGGYKMRKYAFGRGEDDALYAKYQDPGQEWSNYFKVGGTLSAKPTWVVMPDGTHDVYVRGAEKVDPKTGELYAEMYHISVNQQGKFSAWENLGGKIRS